MKFSLSFIALCFFIFSGSLSLYGQTKINTKNLESEADEYFKSEEYFEALPLYLKLDSLKKGNDQCWARIGICYLHSELKYKALPYLEKAQQKGYKKDYLDFYLAQAYHLDHQFDKAISYFKKSKETQNPANIEDLNRIKRIDRYIEMCEHGKEMVKLPLNVKVENLGPVINGPYPEYSPVISADETVLIYTSRRPSTTGGKMDERNQYYEDIYISVKEDGKWTEGKNMGSPVNTSGQDACIGLSPDGQELFIYKSDGGGDIYFSMLNGSNWSTPKKIGGNVNTPHNWEPGASISGDEKVFFFSSDRPGGLGGRDIYVTKKFPNGDWSEPVNLGPKVNTEYDEDSPFIHADGTTLYFSSKGHNSMGGFDIFQVRYNHADNGISDLQNLGYPINTAADELFFVWSADGARGYFSSIRSSDNFGESDLYMITRQAPQVALIVLKGKLFSKKTQKPIAATITVTNNETREIVGVYTSNSSSGKYTLTLPPGKNYGITIEASNHLPYSENVFIASQFQFAEIIKDIFLEPLERGSISVLKNVFFEPSSDKLKKESYIELDKFAKVLKANPSLAVEVAGHSNTLEKDNLSLTQKKAKAVSNYLVSKGIDSKRIHPVGYGDKYNVASNNTEEGRKQNARTELVILSNAGGYSAKDTKGFYNLKELPLAQNNTVDKDTEVKASYVKSLPNIQFEFNSYALESDYKQYLDTWGQYLLKNKKVKVEIGGHTDGVGSNDYNKVLAEKRVNSVKDYLVSTGVNPKRLITKSYGKSKPLAGNDTEEGRKKNRRVEITILR